MISRYREISLLHTRHQSEEVAEVKEGKARELNFLLRTSYVERVAFGREPVQIICKNCGQFVVTEVSRHNGVCAFFTVLVTLFLCTPCAWLPLVVPTCKDTLHACPNCGAIIGVHRYFK
ncbi:lipopolysaccharide-induced tumor necrosis factor-alpha factor homolog [Parasteatoda tepidariorum]|uniref:lipopolysaccharide-induced tumor necrosis factor-alpha factor homolog n=1 Tax=Parasteatoda tepidariorum TaxID=114398 RepID=UPI00077FD4E9|nr:lipopolysaccharide-induced tumor necrosis factor-alpha factor homolog [Parasteatoda tepidariorum]